jgi:glutathione peroxidase
MNQEPGDNDEILNGLKYVRPGNGFVPAFPLTQKVNVNGLVGVDPVWTWMKNQCGPAVPDVTDIAPSWLPVYFNDVAWNFEMILVGRNGYPYRRYATATIPSQITGDLEMLLKQ